MPILLSLLFLCLPATAMTESTPVKKIQVLVLKQALGSDQKPSKQYGELIKGIYLNLSLLPKTVSVSWVDVDNQPELEAHEKNTYDYLVCLGTRSSLVALEQFPSTPMIYSMVLNPEDMGFDEQTFNSKQGVLGGVLARVSPQAYIEAIQEIHPQCKKIGMLYGSDIFTAYAEEIVAEAARKNILVDCQFVATNRTLVPQYKLLVEGNIDLFLMIPDTRFFAKSHQYILQESFRRKIPVIGLSEPYVRAGALWGIVLSPYDIGAQTVEMLNSAIGKKRLSIEYPVENKLIFNQFVANKLQISFPEPLLKKATNLGNQVE